MLSAVLTIFRRRNARLTYRGVNYLAAELKHHHTSSKKGRKARTDRVSERWEKWKDAHFEFLQL